MKKSIEFVSATETTFIVEITCPACGRKTTLEVPKDGLDRYRMGAHIQDAFPAFTATEREYLLSGLCEACQEEVFAPCKE